MKLDNKVANNKLVGKINKTCKVIKNNNNKRLMNNKINKQISRKVNNKNRIKIINKQLNNRTKIFLRQI